MKNAEELSLLFKFDGLLLLTPFYNKSQQRLQFNIPYLYVSSLTLVIFFAVALYTFTAPYNDFTVAQLLVHCGLQMGIVVLLQTRCFFGKSSLDQLMMKLDWIDSTLRKKPNPRRIWTLCVVPNLLWTIWSGIFAWRHFDGHWVKIPHTMLQFLVMILILNSTIFHFTLIQIINGYANEFLGVLGRPGSGVLYKSICDSVKLYNDTFGWSILSNIVTVCCFFLRIFAMQFEDYSEGFFMMYMYSKVFVSTLVIVVLVVRCQKLYRNAGLIKDKVDDLILKNHTSRVLSELAQQTSATFPKVTAADFFSVDYSLLSTLTNLLATYAIVVFQYMESDNRQ